MNCFFDCEEFAKYEVNEPYPEVSDIKRNTKYAAIISGAFAGKGSESTAIAQYSTHRFYLPDYPEAYRAYKYIAFVEMRHWYMLGQLILMLGLSPKLASYETNAFWSGGYPEYEYSFDSIIRTDIRGEWGAIEHYQRMIKQIDDPQIQALFRRIIMDEEKHVQILTGLYEAKTGNGG